MIGMLHQFSALLLYMPMCRNEVKVVILESVWSCPSEKENNHSFILQIGGGRKEFLQEC